MLDEKLAIIRTTSTADISNINHIPDKTLQYGGGGGEYSVDVDSDKDLQVSSPVNFNKYVEIIEKEKKYYKKFNVYGENLKFIINFENYRDGTFEQFMIDSLDYVIQTVTKSYDTYAYIALSFISENPINPPLHISMRLLSQLDSKVVLNSLFKVVQSNETFLASNAINLECAVVETPTAKGRISNLRRNLLSEEQIFKNFTKRVLVRFSNDDNLCFIHAVVLGIDRVERRKSGQSVPDLLLPRHIEKSYRIVQYLNLNITNTGASINDMKLISNYVSSHNIFFQNPVRLVLMKSPKANDFLLPPGINFDLEPVYLAFEKNHFHVITSITGFLNIRYYCDYCLNGFHSRDTHINCLNICAYCKCQTPCLKERNLLHCNDCNKFFANTICLLNHKQEHSVYKKTICETFKKCDLCKKSYRVDEDRKHECFKELCKNCKIKMDPNHLCFIPKYVIKSYYQKILYIFYDFECIINSADNDDITKEYHTPILIVSNTCCNHCLYTEDIFLDCTTCGKRLHIYVGDNIVENFFSDIINLSLKFTKVICVAHNAKSYDNHFLLSFIIKSSIYKNPEIIKQGNKVICIIYQNIKFIDSLNFLKCSLRSVPQMFGIEGVAKGFYPYRFLTKHNLNYKGNIPEIQYFCSDNMKDEERLEFLEWYKEMSNRNYYYDNFSELKFYCEQDVRILRIGCARFHKIFYEKFKFNILLDSLTLPDACSKIYRGFFMNTEEKAIGLIPRYGYNASHSNSKIAIEWLSYMNSMLPTGHEIKHGRNGGECTIENMKVDGLLYINNVKGDTVYELYGCIWHCHTPCKLNRFVEPPWNSYERKNENTKSKKFVRKKLSSIDIHNRDRSKQERLEALGYKVIVQWECEYLEMRNSNQNLRRFIQSNSEELLDFLNIRKGYFGGRTNAINLYYNSLDGSKCRYVDINSQYPFVMISKAMPIKHPEIFVGDSADKFRESIKVTEVSDNGHVVKSVDWNIDGMIYCSIIPPRNLFIPVLPDRINGKLIFHLCSKCAKENVEAIFTVCTHSDDERKITGVFCSPEIKKALEMGYYIQRIHEIWKYKLSVFSEENPDGGIFTEYIRYFYKMKLEADGFPSNVKTDIDKEMYVKRIWESQKILLDKGKIKKNLGLRQVGKLCCNSLYGKFGQNSQTTETVIIDDQSSLLSLLTRLDDEIEDLFLTPCTEENIIASYRYKKDFVRELNTTNLAVASFITCYARLELYQHLQRLGDNTIYFDTDSIFYRETENSYKIPLGECLGMFTDELEKFGKDAYISEGVFLGAKNYAYEVTVPGSNEKFYECKCRGFTINYKNKPNLNFQNMKKILFNELNEIFTENDRIRTSKLSNVYSVSERKKFQMVYNKRMRCIENSFKTYPFGY